MKLEYCVTGIILFCITWPVWSQKIDLSTLPYKVYPNVNDNKPNLPSPFIANNKNEYVIAVTNKEKYAVIPVTLHDGRDICKQLVVDSTDFPVLAETGLHDEKTLKKIKFITGRSVEEITKLARPGGLSSSGFIADDEDILSVLNGDNTIVKRLGFFHPQMAKPLFHVLNMIDEDLALNRWNMAKHQWENIKYFFYNGKKVFVDAEDTKGGQKSIFADGIEGGFYIQIWRMLEKDEMDFLRQKYSYLSARQFGELEQKLCYIHMGEMQAQYIQRYGFYEGHTFWRTDPVTISYIFGMRTLQQIENEFSGQLYEILCNHFVGVK